MNLDNKEFVRKREFIAGMPKLNKEIKEHLEEEMTEISEMGEIDFGIPTEITYSLMNSLIGVALISEKIILKKENK